jgi:hypothetical protein
MKNLALYLTMVVATTGLILSGCNKKADEKPADTTQPAAQPTAAAQPAEAPAAAQGAKPEDSAKMGMEMAKAMAEAGKNVDTSDAPEYMKKMVDHLKAINTLMKDNMDDCQKAVGAVTKYVEENKGALDMIKKETESAQANMSDQEKMKMAQQIMALMGPMLQEMTQVQVQFSQKCATEAQNLAKAMQALK